MSERDMLLVFIIAWWKFLSVMGYRRREKFGLEYMKRVLWRNWDLSKGLWVVFGKVEWRIMYFM